MEIRRYLCAVCLPNAPDVIHGSPGARWANSWTLWDSNSRPDAYKATALPTELLRKMKSAGVAHGLNQGGEPPLAACRSRIFRSLGRRGHTFKGSQGTIISKRLYRGRLLVGATPRTFSRYPWMAWPLR